MISTYNLSGRNRDLLSCSYHLRHSDGACFSQGAFMKTQCQMWRDAEKHSAELNRAFMELVSDKQNPLTNADLIALIKKRPEVYGRFAGFIGKLP